MVNVTIITCGQEGDKPRDIMVAIESGDMTEAEIVAVVWECILDEQLPEGMVTYDALEARISSFAWWSVEKRTLLLDTNETNKAKVQQLARDTRARQLQAADDRDRALRAGVTDSRLVELATQRSYWAGAEFAFSRSITVMEGRG